MNDRDATYPNKINKFFTEQTLKQHMKQFNIRKKVKSIDLFVQALTHLSYMKSRYTLSAHSETIVGFKEKSNEKLIFLGKNLYRYLLSKYIFRRYFDQSSEFLDKIIEEMTKDENYVYTGKIMKHSGLKEYILISRGIENKIGRNDMNLLSDFYYAFLAALSMDSGINVAENYNNSSMEKHIDFGKIVRNLN